MEVASNQTVNALNNNNKQIPHNILFRHTHTKNYYEPVRCQQDNDICYLNGSKRMNKK